jgi:fructokinase
MTSGLSKPPSNAGAVLKTLSIGEVLWDVFPDKRVWGGAPVNFAFYSSQLGAQSSAFSAVGHDESGQALLDAVQATGIDFHAEQVMYPTGIAKIDVDNQGMPTYSFNDDCAWDHIPFSAFLAQRAAEADILSIGTLAQRHPASRSSIQQALSQRKPDARVVCDLNLRLDHYTSDTLTYCLLEADYLKINDEEKNVLEQTFGMNLGNVLKTHQVEVCCLTRGEAGSVVLAGDQTWEQEAIKVDIVDTVGAGDAFTAAFFIQLQQGHEIPDAQAFATKVAAHVCQHQGAITPIPDHGL